MLHDVSFVFSDLKKLEGFLAGRKREMDFIMDLHLPGGSTRECRFSAAKHAFNRNISFTF